MGVHILFKRTGLPIDALTKLVKQYQVNIGLFYQS